MAGPTFIDIAKIFEFILISTLSGTVGLIMP
jgi:hypothetical protein